MNRTLLYIVHNNFENNHSILGVFTSLWNAYEAEHQKWLEVHENYPHHYMKLRIVIPDISDYIACSEYELDFACEFTPEEIRKQQELIENWGMWSSFERMVIEKEAIFLMEEVGSEDFSHSVKGARLIERCKQLMGFSTSEAINYIKRQKHLLA